MAAPVWRFYAQRIVSGEWLDNDVQMTDCSLTYNLSAPNSGSLSMPVPVVEPRGSDGRPVWGKWDTIVYAEKDGDLDSAYIVDSVAPSISGPQVKLIGAAGWLSRVEYSGVYQVWETNTFDVVRELIDHANGKPRGLTFTRPSLDSATTVGDPEPPPKPTKPPRHKGESKSDYDDSTRFHNYQDDLDDWNNTYGSNEKYKLVFWETPFVGDELTSLANDTLFDWRESASWVGGDPSLHIDFADDLSAVRTDIIIEEGVNVVGLLSISDDDQTYANKVLGIGAGQGRNTRKVTSSFDDGRLYSASFISRKHQKNIKQLQRLADRQVTRLRKIDPQIGTTNVYDVPGLGSVETLLPGDIVQVRSTSVSPPIDTHCLVRSKTVNPLNPGTVQLDLETISS